MQSDNKLLTAFLLIFILLGFGTLAYHNLEGWSYVDSLYFTAMTVTTVGYGDFVPTTNSSKLFTIFFSLAGISLALVVLVSIGGDYFRKERRAISNRISAYMENRKLQQRTARRRAKAEKSDRRRLFS